MPEKVRSIWEREKDSVFGMKTGELRREVLPLRGNPGGPGTPQMGGGLGCHTRNQERAGEKRHFWVPPTRVSAAPQLCPKGIYCESLTERASY